MPRPPLRSLLMPAMVVVLFVGALWPTGGPAGRAYQAVVAYLHHVAQMAVAVPSRPFHSFGAWLRAGDADEVDVDQVAEDLRRLQRYKQLILRLDAENRRLRRENATLQELRRRYDRTRFVPRVANVMGRPAGPTARSLTIDLGRRDGLSEGLAVAAGPNLVGRIAPSPGRMTSDVELIVSPGMKLKAVLTPPSWAGGVSASRLRNLVLFEADGPDRLVATPVKQDVQVEVDDLAHLRDETWPNGAQGLVLGRVVEVTTLPENQLFKRVVIEPVRELRYLRDVAVVVPRPTLENPG